MNKSFRKVFLTEELSEEEILAIILAEHHMVTRIKSMTKEEIDLEIKRLEILADEAEQTNPGWTKERDDADVFKETVLFLENKK